jgi:hypothetical protein
MYDHITRVSACMQVLLRFPGGYSIVFSGTELRMTDYMLQGMTPTPTPTPTLCLTGMLEDLQCVSYGPGQVAIALDLTDILSFAWGTSGLELATIFFKFY